MVIIATIRLKRTLWLWSYTVICLVLGVWGAYDYWIKIPRNERDYAAFVVEKGKFDQLEKESQSHELSETNKQEYASIKSFLASFTDGVPEPVPAYDRPLQLWAYIIGTGCIGTPWFLWTLLKNRKMRVEIDDNGTLTDGRVKLRASQIKSIDMSKWMSKSIATVHGTANEIIVIDDYMLENGAAIIGLIAHRFEPENWTIEARRVVKDDDSSALSDSPSDQGSATTDGDPSKRESI